MAKLSNIIDVHSHPVLSFGEKAPMGKGHKQPDWSDESALSYMEEHGISACVLSSPAAANDVTGQEARDIARRANEVLTEIVSRHPARFGAVATFMFDTTRMIINMVATGAKKRFSQIKIISAHGGGTIPYLVNRIRLRRHSIH